MVEGSEAPSEEPGLPFGAPCWWQSGVRNAGRAPLYLERGKKFWADEAFPAYDRPVQFAGALDGVY